jgi:hypothetical protein
MSLINDALRRAKQVQQEVQAPLPGPPLRPVETPAYVRHGVGIVVPVSMTIIALLGLLLLWQIYQRRDSGKSAESSVPVRTVEDKTATEPVVPASMPPVTPTAQTQQKPVAAALSSPKREEPKAPVTTPTLAAVNPTPSDSAAAVTASPTNVAPSTTTVSNAAPPVEPAPPKPEPLKLQGIVFNPKRPSTVINGRTLFLGDRIHEYRITAIRQDSVTMVGGGRTNILSLEQ